MQPLDRTEKPHRAARRRWLYVLPILGLIAAGTHWQRAAAQRDADVIRPPIVPPRPPHPPWPPVPPRPVLNQELRLKTQSARVEIDAAVARTKLTQIFENTTNRTIEGTYVFPLPEGAAVSGFAMTVNGRRVEAEILEGNKAREIYTGIVQKMRDPAILEFIDRNLIRAKIFPIPAGAEQKIEMEYSESLRAGTSAGAGSFRYVLPLRLPIGGAAQKADIDIQIRSSQGIRAVYSPTHAIEVKREGSTAHVSGEFTGSRSGERPAPANGDITTNQNDGGADRDFVLYYTTAKTRVGVNLITQNVSGEDGYFMLLAAPDPEIAPREIAAKDVIFVFDTSGSMYGEKIEQARRALLTLLTNLNPDDRFNVITFASEARGFRDALTPATASNLEAARNFVQGIQAVGGTNIDEALTDALKQMQKSDRPQQVVFMTDGQPTVGETDPAQILKNIRTANETPATRQTDSTQQVDTKARLFVFGVGYDVNTRLLDTLAEDNRGASDYVLPNEDIEEKVGSLYAKIAYPVLSNPQLDWGGLNVYDVFPKRLPDLFRGTQAVVFGRYTGNRTGQVQLIGLSQGHEERIAGQIDTTGSGNDTLPRLWAMRKVGYLVDDARRSGRPVDNEVREEIIKLSKKYGIVTPFTAGLITEDESGPLPIGNPAPDTVMGPRRAGTIRGGFGGRGAGPAGPMASLDSGAGAVQASKANRQMRESSRVREDRDDVRYIEGKAFFLRDGVWTDGSFDEAKSPKPETIKFASPEYLALIKDAKVAKWLSVGEKVLVVLGNRTVKIEP